MQLEVFTVTTTFLIGLIIGSFLNVLVYRRGSGMTLGGRSKCLSCGKTLTPRMLVPLLSWVWQKGHCAYCGTRISPQYALVEGATGLLFALAAYRTGISVFDPVPIEFLRFIVDAGVFSVLVAIVAYDLRHKIIPDSFSLVLSLFALAGTVLRFVVAPPVSVPVVFLMDGSLPGWVDLLAGPLLALPFALLWLLSRGRAMGLGDAKLAVGIGWFLGLTKGVTAIVFAFWSAFVPALLLLALSHGKVTMKSELPFAPFLALGAIIVYLLGVDIFTWAF